MYLKQKVFADELKLIQTPELKEFVSALVNELPDYFFEVAASSTGKYHSETCLGAGGLVRHTKAAIMIAQDLFRDKVFNPFAQEEQDCIIIALMFHDGWKHGQADLNDANFSKYTRFEHPIVAADNVEKAAKKCDINQKYIDLITCAMRSHMGPWTTSTRSSTTLPVPQSNIELFVHLCDYMASRSYLIYKLSTPYDPKNFEVSDNEYEVQNKITQVINICRAKAEASSNKEVLRQRLFGVIEKHNGGKRNPKNIKDLNVINTILAEVEQVSD